MKENKIHSEQILISVLIITVMLINSIISLEREVLRFANIYIAFFLASLIYYKMISKENIIPKKGIIGEIKFYFLMIITYIISATASSLIIILEAPRSILMYIISYCILIFVLIPYRYLIKSSEKIEEETKI